MKVSHMRRFAPLFVGLGAISYGVPATLFKLAGRAGVGNASLLFWSFFTSVAVLTLLQLPRWRRGERLGQPRLMLHVLIAGTASGFTNTFYISALREVSVAVAAVMLMQAVWLSILMGALRQRQWPSRLQGLSVILVLGGTLFAAGFLPHPGRLSLKGLFLSFLAAVAYAITMQATASLAPSMDALGRTWLLCLGAFGLIALVWGPALLAQPVTLTAVAWGGLTAIFSLIIPLACYSFFMKDLPLGVGPVLSSLELPASILFAYLLLGERVTGLQLIGVSAILSAVAMSHLAGRTQKFKRDFKG